MQQDDLMKLIGSLMELTRKISRGEYDHADEIFAFTQADRFPSVVVELAEAFGMMMVQVETREYRLEQIIEELQAKNKELEATLEKVRMLECVKHHLGKFVPSSVKDMIEGNPQCPDLDKRDEDLTVVFLDIAGYTRISEKLEREKVNYLVQTYFSSFLDVIMENKGDINETAGDGLMIIFRSPDENSHAINGVRAAVGIQKKAALLNDIHKGRFEPVLINIGINSGLSSVGSTKFEGIAGARWTFCASGTTTNTAARIGSLATGGSILVGHDTYRRVKDFFELEPAGEHHLKNISKPVQVFRVC